MKKSYTLDKVFERISFYKQEVSTLEKDPKQAKKLYVSQNMLKFWEKYKLNNF